MDYIELESERLLYRKYRMEDYSVFYDMLSNLENIKYRSRSLRTKKMFDNILNGALNVPFRNPV